MAKGKFKGEPLYVHQLRAKQADARNIQVVLELINKFELGSINVEWKLKELAKDMYKGHGVYYKAMLLKSLGKQ